MASSSTSTQRVIKDIPAYMMDMLDSRHHFPQFLWKFFLSNIGPRWQTGYRVHIYDVFADTLHETRRIPQSKPIFADFRAEKLADECLVAIKQAEDSFTRLEASVEHILTRLLHKLSLPPKEETRRRSVTLDAREEHVLLKYLVFLRFRNSEQYHETVLNLGKKASLSHQWMRLIPRGPLRRRAVLRSFCAFLDHGMEESGMGSGSHLSIGHGELFGDIEEHCWKPIMEGRSEISFGIASEAQEFLSAERCFGDLDEVDPDGSCDGSYHLFFPITPSVALYLVTEAPNIPPRPSQNPLQRMPHLDPELPVTPAKRKREEGSHSDISMVASIMPQLKRMRSSPDENSLPSTLKRKRGNGDKAAADTSDHPEPPITKRARTDSILTVIPSSSTGQSVLYHQPSRLVTIECDTESVPDVHTRNAILLRSSPRYILFSSLVSVITAITIASSYSHSSSSSPSSTYEAPLELNRLKAMCREKSIREGLMKTLLVKGDVPVVDLTDEVKLYGDCAVEHGSFADIWKGEWVEKGPLGPGTKRLIAMKVLRQFMVDNVKEKLLKRLKDEVVTWHRLRHPHIAPLFGIVQLPHHLAMVSPWCDNGTIVHYLRDINPGADRILLMLQIASGIAYLHNFKPFVIHGDLKGNNILVSSSGHALITDFGVSKVIEDFSSHALHPSSSSSASSLAAGATRWMAPELVLALVEDEHPVPGEAAEPGAGKIELTRASDVYAFGCVCLEIATGQLPYPTRTNPHSVTIDKMRGVKPSSGVKRDTIPYALGPGIPPHLPQGDTNVKTAQDEFWDMMNRCWDERYLRPDMSELTEWFTGLLKRKTSV